MTVFSFPNGTVLGLADVDKNGTSDVLWQQDPTRKVDGVVRGWRRGDRASRQAWIPASPVPGWLSFTR
jgi:hypothetical protein